jgi:hypothetical protein
VSHRPFGAADRHSCFTPERVSIETDDGTVLEALDQPRASFAGYALETPWSTLQLAYFVGTAMWTYLTQPFTFTLPGFQTTELEPWDEQGSAGGACVSPGPATSPRTALNRRCTSTGTACWHATITTSRSTPAIRPRTTSRTT